MAFTDSQMRLLKAKLDPKYIRTRNSNGCTLSYVEGWHAIAEANRIFGYEAWDRRTVRASCVWSEAKGGSYRAVYTAKVRITVRAGAVKVVREGSGSCEASAATMPSGPWVLRSPAGSSVSSHDTPTAFIVALRRAMTEAKDIELLYDVWEQNIDTLLCTDLRKKSLGLFPSWSHIFGRALLAS